MNLLIAALGGALILFLTILSLQFLYGYRIEDRAIAVVLFKRLPVYRVPLEDIEVIKTVSWTEIGIGGRTMRLGNRLARRCVLIQKRSGWLPLIAITPANPERFVTEVAMRREAMWAGGRQ